MESSRGRSPGLPHPRHVSTARVFGSPHPLQATVQRGRMASNQGQPPEEKVLGFTLTKGQERDEKCDKEDARESPIFDMQMKANNWPRPVRRTTSE
ncbi:unnamed protein product, partial [Nesidiocoris tenuis]